MFYQVRAHFTELATIVLMSHFILMALTQSRVASVRGTEAGICSKMLARSISRHVTRKNV
jgi:hypothetical protein